jgi:hypothetical protein
MRGTCVDCQQLTMLPGQVSFGYRSKLISVLFHDGKRDACCLPGNRERLTGHQGGARLVQNAAAARTAALGEAVGDPARLVEG